MNIKAALTLTLTAGLIATSTLPIAPRFAERLAEYEATKDGIAVVHAVQLAQPNDTHLERTRDALTRHCRNLVDAYNTGAQITADDLTAAHLPTSLNAGSCE